MLSYKFLLTLSGCGIIGKVIDKIIAPTSVIKENTKKWNLKILYAIN